MGTQLLTLVRHGKSSWQTAGQSDHERPLNDRGRKDSPAMAKRLADRGCVPDLVLCSSATRTQETARYLIDGLGLGENNILTSADLYLASPAMLLTELQRLAAGCAHAMIIAHNPGLEDLSALLSSDCITPMPTLGIRHFAYESDKDLRRCLENQGNVQDPSQGNRVEFLFEDYPKKR